jgi:aminoglycoside phosphotransferase (APT) family kinase protein
VAHEARGYVCQSAKPALPRRSGAGLVRASEVDRCAGTGRTERQSGASKPTVSREEALAELLRQAQLPDAVRVLPLVGRGFTGGVHAVELADGRRVILRVWSRPGVPEQPRAAFLAAHGVPAPGLLAATAAGSLHEFAHGTLLGDLIETQRDSATAWRHVGHAFQRVHAVRFPSGVEGDVLPDRLVLRPADPAARLHERIDESASGLGRRSPGALPHLAALHDLVERAAPSLRSAETALGHGDIHMWNIIVADDRAWLIDWEEPRVCDPAMELALLDKHAALFNGRGLDRAFFDGYGRAAPEPNTSLHRVVQTVSWVASADWDSFERQDLPADLRRRARRWLRTLLAYVAGLPAHIERVR